MSNLISTENEVYYINHHGVKHGECKEFSSFGTRLISISNFEDGVRQGIRTYYGEGRSIIAEYHYVNGKRHGECKNFHDNGKVGIKQNYKDGMRHGKRYEYDSDGVLVYVGLYFEDKEIMVDVLTLSEADYAYIMISGRLPMRGW